jgi:hypothetical protein
VENDVKLLKNKKNDETRAHGKNQNKREDIHIVTIPPVIKIPIQPVEEG